MIQLSKERIIDTKPEDVRTQKRRKKIEKIRRKAARVFSEKGFIASSLSDVSRAAGLSKGGIYHYFSTKDELLFLIADNYMDVILNGVEKEIGKIQEPEEKIRYFVKRHIRLYSENVHESHVIFHDFYDLSPGKLKIVQQKTKKYIEILAHALDDYFAGSKVAPTTMKVAILSLVGMVNWIYWWYDPKGSMKPDELSDTICDIFLYDLKSRLYRDPK